MTGASLQSTSESLLVQLNSVDNVDAWSRFVQLYTPLIFYWARKTGLQSQDAADLVQDVLTVVFQKLPQFKYDRSRSFRGWLRTITLNRHHQLARKKRPNTIGASQSLLASLPDDELAETNWDVNYARQLVATAMDMMQSDFSPKTWKALRQLLSTGLPASEIARETGISVWTLYAAKTRLMSRLRKELDGLLD